MQGIHFARRLRAGLIVWLFIAIVTLFAAPQTRAQEGERPIVLLGGQLLDGYEAAPIAHSAVVIQGNRIIAAGRRDEVEIPAGAAIIDTRGKTVLPGLIDLHLHMELIGHGDYQEYYNFIGGTERLGEMRAIAAKQLLRAGVTTVVDLGSTLGILDTREAVANGEIPGPRMVVSGPWISRLPVSIVPEEMQYVISSPEEAARRTVQLIEDGVDVVKAWEGLTQEDYNAIVREAHARGVKVHAHLYDPNKVELALNAGVDVLQHMGSARNSPYSDALIARIAHANKPVVQTIAHRIWIYPETVQFPTRLEDPRLRHDLPPALYDEFQRSFQHFHRNDYFRQVERESRLAQVAARQFIEANAVMGVGTDGGSPMNFHFDALWREMSALVDAGMSPIQVISAATKTNAEILGNMQLLGGSRAVGTVEPGMLADVIVVDGDPLFDINVLGYVDLVIKDGTPWYTDEQARAMPVLSDIGRAYD